MTVKLGSATGRAGASPRLRLVHREATLNLIMEALIGQLRSHRLEELTMRDVADKAGIAERTLFRHFPNREALFAAARARIPDVLGVPPPAQTLAELRRYAPLIFDRFDEHRSLVENLLFTPGGQEVLKPERRRRLAAVQTIVDGTAPGAPAAERERVSHLVRYLLSAYTWHFFRFQFGLSQQDTIDAVNWAVGALLDRLERTGTADSRPMTSGTAPSRALNRRRERRRGGGGARESTPTTKPPTAGTT
jgi:AcrR family transcriptional regulator